MQDFGYVRLNEVDQVDEHAVPALAPFKQIIVLPLDLS
jgi:hypothetical protein